VSRRSGLGRGLAALIPPSEPDDRRDPAADDDLSGEVSASSGVDDPTAPALEAPNEAGGPSTTGTRSDPDPDEDAPSPPGASAAAPLGAAGSGTLVGPTREGLRNQRLRDGTEGASEVISETDEPVPPAARTPAPGAATGPSDADEPDVVVPPAVAPGAGAHGTATGHQPSDASDASGDVAHVPPAAATLAEVAPGSIVPNPRQPREVFDPDELAHLATSLADVGILQPLVVRPLEDGGYELVAGERRLRAAMLAGLNTVPVVIRHTDDADLLKEALVENIHRVQLNPLEEGAAYQQLLEEFGVTQEELATRLGRSRPSISNAIRLLQLPSGVQRRVASGVLSAGHAKVLLAIEDPDQQVRLADRIVAEGMSVRATEELVRLRLLDEPSRPAAARRGPVTAPGLVELQDDLSDALDARVRISMGAKRGRLAIEFGSVDDLERIVSVIANGLEGSREVAPVPPAIREGTAPEHG
jgi:ParB family transcriptional regulator, chromosome partitioning protein